MAEFGLVIGARLGRLRHLTSLRAVLAVALVGGLFLTGCAKESAAHGVERASSALPASGDPSPARSSDPASTATKPHRPSDALAPKHLPPVKRVGEPRRPRQGAETAGLHRAVVFKDGVRLRILGIDQGKVSGAGSGVLTGHTTTFTVRLVNNSARPVDLASVVVTAVYGDPGRIARPVYDSRSQDFSGVLHRGQSATARYGFAIPVGDLSKVLIHVDFDSRHAAAQFRGNAR